MMGKQLQTDWQRARRPEQKEERRTAILNAAAKLLDKAGIEGTGLNAIAREAEISKPNLYRYFESREAILLHVLVEEHRGWTLAFRRKLLRLAGTNDIDAVASAFAETIACRKRYCVLIGALATVLEHNVGPETVIEFKRQLNTESQTLISALQAALTGLIDRQAYITLATLVMAASGMWPHCHPAPVVQQVLQQPEFESMRFDFKSMVKDHAALLLRGQLVSPSTSI